MNAQKCQKLFMKLYFFKFFCYAIRNCDLKYDPGYMLWYVILF